MTQEYTDGGKYINVNEGNKDIND